MATVLCVSHEWNLSLETVRSLADAGHCLLTGVNAYQGMQLFAAHQVDALVVNSRLPDLDVHSFISYLKAHNPRLPVIMVSPIAMPEKPRSVDAIMPKAHCPDLLAPTLDRLIRTDALHGFHTKKPRGDSAA